MCLGIRKRMSLLPFLAARTLRIYKQCIGRFEHNIQLSWTDHFSLPVSDQDRCQYRGPLEDESLIFNTKQSQRSKASAQQELSLARRRLFYAQTIIKFESQFQYPLWESEKERLAQLLHLKVERPVRNENVIWDASSFSQQAQGSAKVAQSDSRSVRDVRDNPESDAVRNIEGDGNPRPNDIEEEFPDLPDPE